MKCKRRKQTTRHGQVSSTELADFPPEVLSDILCRLPIESILASRAVCTTLCAVTRDPNFIRMLGVSPNENKRVILKERPRGARPTSPISHLVLVDIEERKTRQIPLKRSLGNLEVTSSCNGLLAIARSKRLNPVAICNPITREHVILPPSSSGRPQCRHQQVGLGFDAVSNTYKAVRAYSILVRGDSDPVTAFEIISLGDRSWRKMEAPEELLHTVVHSFDFWSGALYCTMHMGNDPIVVQINLSAETFRSIPFEGGLSSGGDSLGLIEVGGSLHFIKHYTYIIRAWRLIVDEDGGGVSFITQGPAYVTSVEWKPKVNKFLCQLDENSYLAQVGHVDCTDGRRDILKLYSAKHLTNLDLPIPGLPSRFDTICFRPSLVPLQSAFSDPLARQG